MKLRPEIAALPPYKQGKPAAADAFKLSSNETPFPPLPAVHEAIVAAAADVNRYPDGGALRLRQTIADWQGVSVDRIHVGSGSLAILSQFINAAAGPGDEILYAWRSFEAYPGLVTVAGATSVQIANRPDGSHDLDAMAAAVTDRTRLIIVCTPNNPTSTIVTKDAFAAFVAAVPSDVLIVLDEAYREFVTDPDAVNGIPLLDAHPNVIVLRTFSKAYGLAGLRIGWAIGHPAILEAARNAALALSITAAAQDAAAAAIAHLPEIETRSAEISTRRDQVAGALREQGWFIPEANGNFVWLALGAESVAANDVFVANGIVGRLFPGDGLRISIGEEESVENLLTAAAEIVATLPDGHPARRVA
ncbi:histidinol-phosphate transaminase [Plantibacter sp. Mn2098]|uniref:histidinol-phosphate transaminase n=1 Tax=Plantibacter sp. Mn2098 TaxID=3395266 RepID=UPI003BDC641A